MRPMPTMASHLAAKAAYSTATASAVSSPTKLDIIHAYRHILRCSLSAVQRAPRAVPTVRRQVRAAFTETKAEQFDPEVVKRTGWFLKAAAKTVGVEHRVVKNLVRVAYERRKATEDWSMMMKNNE